MNAPAGWYTDNQDATLIRYWDGAQWTSHTAPKPVQAPTTLAQGPAIPPQAASTTTSPVSKPKSSPTLDVERIKSFLVLALTSRAVWAAAPLVIAWIFIFRFFYTDNVGAGFTSGEAIERSLTPATFIVGLITALLFLTFYGGRFAGFVHRAGKTPANFSLYDQSCSELMGLKDGVDFTMKTHIAQIVYNRSKSSHCSTCTSPGVRNWAFDWTTKG